MNESASQISARENALVLVTGCTGYVGSRLVQALLGYRYRVRGTVRDIRDRDKIDPLKRVWKDNTDAPLNILEANLLKDEGWDEAVKGCEFAIHAAGPFPTKPPVDEEEDLRKPMVDGTRRVLEACANEVPNGFKRLIISGTIASVHGETTIEEGRVYDENDWTNIDSPDTEPYAKYSTMAERMAWDYVNKLPPENKFELVVINGGYAVGPVLSKRMSAGKEAVYRLMNRRRLPLLPEISVPICDIRDMVQAQLRAMVVPEAAGHRHIVVSDHLWFKEMALILDREFGTRGYKIATHYAPYAVLWLASTFDQSIKLTMNRYYKEFKYDSSKAKRVLDIRFRDAKKSILDSAHSLIKYGIVERTERYVEPDYDFQN